MSSGTGLVSETGYNTISNVGTNALWLGFAAFSMAGLRIFGKAFQRCPSKRIFHYLAFSVCGCAALSYMTMAAGMGYREVRGRQLFYGRYIDWTFSTPMILTCLGTLARLTPPNIFALVTLDLLMLATGILGAMSEGIVLWAFFIFSMLCFAPLVYFLFEDFDIERMTKEVGKVSANSYKSLSYTLAGIWTLYPLLWILSVTRSISTDGEVVFFMVLDVSAKAVFLSWLIGTDPTMPDDEDEEEEEVEDEELPIEEGKPKVDVGVTVKA